MKPFRQRYLAPLFAAALFCPVHAFAWTFAVNPDIHTYDACYGPPPTGTVNADNRLLTDVREQGAEFLLISGDFFSGQWLTNAEARATYGIAPNGTFSLSQFLLTCGGLSYDDVLRRFQNPTTGLPIVGAVGDHELGDNNWDVSSEKSRGVPYFKQAFANAFTLNSDGSSKYAGFIGDVPQRPIGTPYADTSYAFIKDNVLFVIVDIFRFDDPNVRLHNQTGSVASDMTGDHLAWFDAVLAAGRQVPGVQFVVVAGHDPVILPVNLIDTSAMTVVGAENSAFWQTIRKHKVELYLPGEVHSLTPSIDNVGPTVQLVSGYKNYSHSHLLVDVGNNRIDVRLREHTDGSYTTYATTGTMAIVKANDSINVTGTGNLTPIDRDGLTIGYNLDGTSFSGKIPNVGQLNRYYHGLATNVVSTNGVIGNGATFTGAANSAIRLPYTSATRLHLNPIIKDTARTAACWVRTTSAGVGTAMALSSGSGLFALRMNNGLPFVTAGNATIRASTSVEQINDGQWHHIATTFPGPGATAADVTLYVDGAPVPSTADRPSQKLDTWPFGGMSIGADVAQSNGFAGSLDDCGVWSSALLPGMIAALHESGRDPAIKLDAATLDKAFRVFRTSTPATVLDRTWYPTSGLPGAPGTITKTAAGDYTIVLTTNGGGVTTLTDEPPPPPPPPVTNLMLNGSFESDFTGWVATGVGVITTGDKVDGEKAALFTRGSSFQTWMFQDRRATQGGTFTVTARYKRNAPFRAINLGIKRIRPGIPTLTRTQALATQGAWATGTTSVEASAGDQVQIFIWIDGFTGGELYLDNFVLTRQ